CPSSRCVYRPANCLADTAAFGIRFCGRFHSSVKSEVVSCSGRTSARIGQGETSMASHLDWFKALTKQHCAAVMIGTAIAALGFPAGAVAAPVTQCTALDICYCVNSDFRDAITENVAR